MKRLIPRAGRIAALGVLAAALALCWFGILAPVYGAFVALDREKDELLALRDRYARLAATRTERRSQRDALLGREATIGGLVDAPNAASAAAQIQTAVKGIVDEVGGEVRRVVVLPAEGDGVLERVGLRVLAKIEIAGLVDLLSALELDDDAYRLGRLHLKTHHAARRADGAGALTLQFEVFAHRRRAADAATEVQING